MFGNKFYGKSKNALKFAESIGPDVNFWLSPYKPKASTKLDFCPQLTIERVQQENLELWLLVCSAAFPSELARCPGPAVVLCGAAVM